MAILSVSELCLSFGGVQALNEVDMEIERDSMVSIIGPNGSGKTTLLNVLSGIYKPDKGMISMKGERIDGFKPDKINKKGITRTFQLIRLFSTMNVLENVIVGGHSVVKTSLADDVFNTRRRKKEQKTLEEKAQQLIGEFGLTDVIYENVDGLPYGTKRKVEIVRALVSDPEILLLDEPAAGMNNRESEELKELIRAINKRGHTILLVEHDLKMVLDISDKIFVLNQGKRIAYDVPSEIRQNTAVIEAYVGNRKKKLY